MAYCCISQHLNAPGSTWCVECGKLVAGALIDDYRVVSYIGKGSSSEVYLAEQYSLNHRKVVIKLLQRSCDQHHVENFQREAAVLASLSHPYILPIFSFGVIYERQAATTTCLPYLVLPYAEQGSLAGSFEREGKRPWSLERVVSLTRDVAEALDYAHSRGVLHRDVKPANLLHMGSHVLLSDFSVASLIDADSSHLSVGWAGSPAFMAPEVWGLRPGRYSDQYALAITCFFLLAGDYPWRGSEQGYPRNWRSLHCFVPPSLLSEFRANIPPAVNVVLQRALAKDPHDRYPGVQDFASDLLAASQDNTQQLVKMPAALVAESASVSPANIRPEGRAWHGAQHVQVIPAVEPVTAPAHLLAGQPPKRVKRAVQMPESDTESLQRPRYNNKWIWWALVLNVLICLVLAVEYSWQAGEVSVGIDLGLALCPAVLVGPLLACLFRRACIKTLSWGVFCGVFFGLTNALLSALVCYAWRALSLTLPFLGGSGSILDNFLNEARAVEFMPPAVELILLGLWMSVIGGALIGIFSVRDEGAAPLAHQGSRK